METSGKLSEAIKSPHFKTIYLVIFKYGYTFSQKFEFSPSALVDVREENNSNYASTSFTSSVSFVVISGAL